MANATGSPWAFLIAAASIVVWGLAGSMFHYSDTWQLVINTATTIITFLMVFLIQNTQNRDTKALHLKLDELLRGVGGARTSLVNLENLSDEELDRLQKQFEQIKRRGFLCIDLRFRGARTPLAAAFRLLPRAIADLQ
jgi:low affinity Fe/Cu permease